MTKFLGLLSPAFCLAATLSHGDTSDQLLELINNYIDRNLHVVDPAKIRFTPTHDRELEFQKAVLEICYVKDTGQGRDATKGLKVGETKRRAEATEFLKFFGAPWTDEFGLVHTCPAGCCGEGPCADKQKSMDRAKALAAKIFMPPISEPAANKYTKVDPCVKSCVLITWMYGLLRKALGEKLKKATEKDPGLAAVVPGHAAVIPATVDTDGAIGIPRDTIEYHRRMGHIKLQKVHAFLCHGYSKYMCLVWHCTAHGFALLPLPTRHVLEPS